MRIEIRRVFLEETFTIGQVWIGDTFFCWSLEDRVRPFGEKVYGETAIPSGEYEVQIRRSSKFLGDMPYLTNVPGFSGIMIHWGNSIADTLGCILVGYVEDRDQGMIMDSRRCFSDLWAKIKDAKARGEAVVVAISGST